MICSELIDRFASTSNIFRYRNISPVSRWYAHDFSKHDIKNISIIKIQNFNNTQTEFVTVLDARLLLKFN